MSEWKKLKRSKKSGKRLLAVIKGEFDPKKSVTTQATSYLNIPHTWFQMVLHEGDAVLLSQLCNNYEIYKKAKRLGKGGWFYCTVKSIQKWLNIKKDKQAAILKRLELCKFIELDYRKPPCGKGRNVRWVKVRRKWIFRIAATVELDGPEVLARGLKWLKKAEKKKCNKIKSRFGKHLIKSSFNSPKRRRKRKAKERELREAWERGRVAS